MGNTVESAINLLIVDDHALLREALVALLHDEPGLSVVAQAGDGREAVDAFREAAPDVTLMDVVMPRMDGIEALARIRGEDDSAKVLMLSGYFSEDLLLQALRLGAAGYVVKGASGAELPLALRTVYQGNRYFSRELIAAFDMDRLVQRAQSQGTVAGRPVLTRREREVLHLLASGCTNRGIAEELGISERTAEVHVGRIKAKLGASGRADVLRRAAAAGMVHLDHMEALPLELAHGAADGAEEPVRPS